MTSWPARLNEVARAVPTLPAPMIAIFMSGILRWLDEFAYVKQDLLLT